MKKIYIQPDMFPMGQEPNMIHEDENGTYYYESELNDFYHSNMHILNHGGVCTKDVDNKLISLNYAIDFKDLSNLLDENKYSNTAEALVDEISVLFDTQMTLVSAHLVTPGIIHLLFQEA